MVNSIEALVKSRKSATQYSLESIALMMSFKTLVATITVLCFFPKPDCKSFKMLYCNKKKNFQLITGFYVNVIIQPAQSHSAAYMAAGKGVTAAPVLGSN